MMQSALGPTYKLVPCRHQRVATTGQKVLEFLLLLMQKNVDASSDVCWPRYTPMFRLSKVPKPLKFSPGLYPEEGPVPLMLHLEWAMSSSGNQG